MSTTAQPSLGGTRVSRAVFGVPPKTPTLTMLTGAVSKVAHADGSGGTPEPTRETRVPPAHS